MFNDIVEMLLKVRAKVIFVEQDSVNIFRYILILASNE